MTDFNYSTVLTRCTLLSAMALGIGVASSILPPATSFVGALVPLIWYHTMFLRPRAAEGLPQPAIDSVYYYRFLITIGALGATNVAIAGEAVWDEEAMERRADALSHFAARVWPYPAALISADAIP